MHIALSQNLTTEIDDADAALVESRNWWVNIGNHGYRYAVTRIAGRLVYLHRHLMGPKQGEIVDHIDGDTLNNRRSNLRIGTQRLNMANSRYEVGASKFRGVSKSGSGWRARVVIAGVRTHLGTYASPEEAARVRDAAAVAEYGSFALLNFQQQAT